MLFGGGELLDFALEDSLDEGFAGGEMAVEGAGTDPGGAGDVFKTDACAFTGEELPGDVQDALAVPLGIGAGFATWWRGIPYRHVR